MAACVLVVDNDSAIQEFVCQALLDEGYAVYRASNGVEALDIVLQSKPHLVLLDLIIPILDGWKFLDLYCEMEAHAPIIVFTTSGQFESYSPYVSEFLAKPFNLTTLLDLVTKYVPLDLASDL